MISVSRVYDDDKIAWYENDGNENFTTHTITTSADNAHSVYAVDGDGDIDVFSASSKDHKIAWYENDGNENFTTHTITTDAINAMSVYAIDVDSVGDTDVLSASWIDGKVAWYENTGIVGIVVNNTPVIPVTTMLYDNYPNHFNPATTIKYQIFDLSFVTLKVYNILGGEVAALVNEEKPAVNYEVEFDATGLSSGIYFYRLQAANFIETKKLVVMK